MTTSLGAFSTIAVAAIALAWGGSAAWRARRLQARLAAAEQAQQRLRGELARAEAACSAAEARARVAEQRSEMALRSSLDGSWEWRPASGRVLLSPRWLGMLGHGAREGEAPRDEWFAHLHPGDRPAFAAALERVAAGAQPQLEHELRLLHRDGGARHVLSRAMPIRGDDGRIERVIGLDTDVTRVKRVQAVLDAVADGTAGAQGERFFAAMAEHFARALDVTAAFITECADQPVTRVRTLAYWSAESGPRQNFEYSLAGTPCEEVVAEGRTCFHPSGLAERFPREKGWEAYVGVPIVGSDGRVLGHLALLDRAPLSDEVLVDRVYRIFVARAAAEIERLQALARLGSASA